MKKLILVVTATVILSGCAYNPQRVDSYQLCKDMNPSLEDMLLYSKDASQAEAELRSRGIDPYGMECGSARAKTSTSCMTMHNGDVHCNTK